MIAEVPEYNTYRVRATFRNDAGSAVVPTLGYYRVDDITGGVVTSVIATTSFVPTYDYYDIVIPYGVNIILDQAHDKETRLVTVKFNYGTGRQGADEWAFTLRNLRRIENLT